MNAMSSAATSSSVSALSGLTLMQHYGELVIHDANQVTQPVAVAPVQTPTPGNATLAEIMSNPNFNMAAFATIIASNDVGGGHGTPWTAAQVESMAGHMDNEMMNLATAGLFNSGESGGELAHQIVESTINPPSTSYLAAEYTGTITDAQAEYAIQIIGSTYGYHLPGAQF